MVSEHYYYYYYYYYYSSCCTILFKTTNNMLGLDIPNANEYFHICTFNSFLIKVAQRIRDMNRQNSYIIEKKARGITPPETGRKN